MALSYKQQIAAEKKRIANERKIKQREAQRQNQLDKLRKQRELDLAKRDARIARRQAKEEHPIFRALHPQKARKSKPVSKRIKRTVGGLFRREW